MDLREATTYCALSVRTLRNHIHSPVDPLPASVVGGKILINRVDLDRWLRQRRIQAEIDVDRIVKELVG